VHLAEQAARKGNKVEADAHAGNILAIENNNHQLQASVLGHQSQHELGHAQLEQQTRIENAKLAFQTAKANMDNATKMAYYQGRSAKTTGNINKYAIDQQKIIAEELRHYKASQAYVDLEKRISAKAGGTKWRESNDLISQGLRKERDDEALRDVLTVLSSATGNVATPPGSSTK
jgi:hypothetical protein